jgi:hypothetical protein
MSRQIAIAAFAAALAVSPMLVTPAEAQNARRNNALAIGLAAGVGGLLIGSAIANAQPRHAPVYHGEPRYYGERRFYREAAFADEPTCVRRPINRIDSYTGEIVTVGSRIVCR